MKQFKVDYDKLNEDDRGIIANVIPEGEVIKSVLYITGHGKAERGNHVHKVDTHYCICLTGEIVYTFIEKNGTKTKIGMLPGDVVYTPAGEPHSFTFVGEGSFLALATEARTQESYEADTTRQQL